VTPLALTTSELLWWITLGAGLAVALLVWLLLELLRRRVSDVERAVDDVWANGKRLAQNTQTSHLLATTTARTRDLRAELERTRES